MILLKPPASVELFLALSKRYVREKGLIIVPRIQNEACMRLYGISPASLEQMVLDLKTGDCFDGPEPDRDERFSDSRTVAEFRVTGERIDYCLKLSVSSRHKRCKCLSFKPFSDRIRSKDGFTVL